MKLKLFPKRHKVVIVDSNRTLANGTVNLLQVYGYLVLPAFSGEDALHLARHFSPQCMVIDFSLSDMNGVELAQAVLELVPSCKIVLSSDQAQAVHCFRRLRAKGVYAQLLQKPVQRELLLDTIADALALEKPSAPPVGPWARLSA